jgi:hypothetical protein
VELKLFFIFLFFLMVVSMKDLTKAERRKLKKAERKEVRVKERIERLNAQRKKKFFTYFSISILLIALVYLFYWQSQLPGKYDDFAKCLKEEGFVMAGTDWCTFCKEQKSLFGKSFQFVDYKNCDVQKSFCDSNGVKGYPTWVTPDGTKGGGVKQLLELSQLSGCSLE